MIQDIAPDRRAELKARHRQAILNAADSLIRERGKPRFSVDELAKRADVARRTVFNHFSSLDDVIMTTCTRVVSDAVEEFRATTAAMPVGDGSRVALFDEITATLRNMDLPTVVAYLWRVLSDEDNAGKSQMAVQDVFTRTTEQLSAEMAQRSRELDEFEVAVMVTSLMNGIAVVCRYWMVQTGAELTEASRKVWDDLLDRLITSVRAGYAPPA
ncbi:TetR family transcriptional regulator [Glaciihabitans tibetensis]|uniref:TetR family transcriptional regulator n=1 Tax=Glaciihabitans tibetensis TaxID=1266600 RepID=A0A2T0VBZ1_9MICO|nr:TetR/AcrR family transcriptional regulator [Glaciihabitans tibetensis]PRY67694.1 TetR family transcriptional regulator [Glaciihabitans tibetensis]